MHAYDVVFTVTAMLWIEVFQSQRILRYKRAPANTKEWAIAAVIHQICWTAIVAISTGFGLPVWVYVVGSVVHFATDCTPLGEWLMELIGVPTVRGAVFVSHENDVPAQLAALEYALAAAHEWSAKLVVHAALVIAMVWSGTP